MHDPELDPSREYDRALCDRQDLLSKQLIGSGIFFLRTNGETDGMIEVLLERCRIVNTERKRPM